VAFLVLLERLAPEERAAFLLREVFDCEYGEIAQILARTEAACRQIVHRARERVRRDRSRFAVPAQAKEQLLVRFLTALEAGDRDALLAVFDEDATWTSDGGGKVAAARNVLRGAARIARFLVGIERKWPELTHRIELVNGEPAVLTCVEGRAYATTSFETDGSRILAAYRVLNPDKLRRLAAARWEAT
jgi:RNA polymerase sigma-70 factor (ECF subfamily)